MTAKPIVDILVGVENAPHSNEIIPRLTSMGYEDLGGAGIPGRLYLRKEATLPITFILCYIVATSGTITS